MQKNLQSCVWKMKEDTSKMKLLFVSCNWLMNMRCLQEDAVLLFRPLPKTFWKQQKSGSNLPSVRSAERFVDRGHVIGKIHVAETLLQWENWDLHTDGTSRCGKKYVCQQMTVGSKTVSTGFTSVGTENAYLGECQQSCVTVLLSWSLLGVHLIGRDGEFFKQMKNYSCSTARLGLGTARQTVLIKMEKEGGHRLGCDRLSKFQSYKNASESAVSRQVQIFSLLRFLNYAE